MKEVEKLSRNVELLPNYYATEKGDCRMVCQLCGVEAETKYVEFYQNIGAFIMRFHKSLKGKLCKNCIHQQFWGFTLVNVTLGWWGVISLIVTPCFLINNAVRYLMCLSMPPVGANALASQLTNEATGKIQPYTTYIIEQLYAGQTVDRLAYDIASNAGVTPAQVKLYIIALAQAAR